MSIFKANSNSNTNASLLEEKTTFNKHETELFYDSKVTNELNLYRNMMPIALNVEPVLDFEKGSPEGDEPYLVKDPQQILEGGIFEGRHSLFNRTNAVMGNSNAQVNMNAPLFDTPQIREHIRKQSDCSVKALVRASENNEMGRAVYSYADFMFCTHLGKVSNNYLVTLRRFPHPAGDHINYTLHDSQYKSTGEKNNQEYNAHMPAIGTLVTWLGTPGNDMSSILKYDVNLPYKEMTAQIEPGDVDADTSGGGILGGLLNVGNRGYRNASLRGAAGSSGIGFIQKSLGGFKGGGWLVGKMEAPNNTSWAYHRDMTKAYGPVDSIAKTHIRKGPEDEGGIKFEHNITLTFDYTLRAFDGINARAAMLDLIANILSVTYTNATYWRGVVHGNGYAQSNVFANLPIFHMQSPLSMAGLVNSVGSSLGQIGSLFNNGNPINGIQDVINMGKNLLQGMFEMGAAGLLNGLGRPQRQGLNSLLNFAPTGVWHLMIGNPKHPIMSMGNMILDNCSIEHYGPLGLDDFPTGLKITITLKHGTPRDNLRIEQMYMNGDFRIYQPLGNRGLEAWAQAESLYKSNKESNYVEALENYISSASNPPEKGKNESQADYEKRLKTWSDQRQNELNTIDLAQESAGHNKTYIKWFGTTDTIDILKTIKEAHLGSEPKSTDAEADAQKKLAEKAKEKNKNK